MKNWRCVDKEEDDSENSRRKFENNISKNPKRETDIEETETRNIKGKMLKITKERQENKGHRDINVRGVFNVYYAVVWLLILEHDFCIYMNKAKPVDHIQR